MADSPYVDQNFLFRSKGVSARYVDDALEPGQYILQTSLEEIEENGLATRLGTKIVNKVGSTAYPLGGSGSTAVHSLSKLPGINGNAWRYAGMGTSLYRINGTNPGVYSEIYSAMSGNRWTAVQYQPAISSYPYIYIADSNVMLKDNGQLSNSVSVSSATSTGTSVGGGTAWTNPNYIDDPTNFATVSLASGGTNYTPSTSSGSASSTANQYNPSVVHTTDLGGFASVPATSATLFVTISGGMSAGNGGWMELYYSVDNGVTWTISQYWNATFSSTVVPISISGFTNLNTVKIRILADAEWNYGGPVTTAVGVGNWYAIIAGSSSQNSQVLQAAITGLSVPSNANIVGFSISFTGEYSGAVPSLIAYLSVGTSQKPFTLTTSPAPYTGGAPTDLWGYGAWLPTTLSGLTVNFIASTTGISTVSLNNLVVTVYYAVTAATQNIGIFQPRYPVQAKAEPPDEIIFDTFSTGSAVVSTTTTAAITSTGLQTVPVASLSSLGLFQSLIIDTGGNAETVLVIGVTKTGITANFTKTHANGVAVVEMGSSTTVGASTTGTLSGSLATSISTWPTTLDPADYIGLWLYVGDPNAIDSITLQFNTANGAYFYRTIGQGPLQATLNSATDSTTAAADAVITETLGLYTSGAGGVTGLSTVPGWTPILLQLSDFSGAGGADFNDPSMNWQNVTTYAIKIVTNAGIAGTSFPITVKAASLLLFGGAGPDSFAGVSYDYMVTLFNIVDYTESNPSMVMTDVDPPFVTNRVVPRRQPVLLSWTNSNVDPQATHWRVYRRGGTLGDNYRRIDQIPITVATGGTQTYTDIWSDVEIQGADVISFTNDVPVTSPLPVPMNNLINTAITTKNQVATVVFAAPYDTAAPGFTQSIFVGQQVTMGNVAATNFETVIVLSLTTSGATITGFTAFVQNTHAIGEPLTATAKYGQPLNIMAVAFDQGWYAGDENNPSNIYWTPKGNVQSVSSAAYAPVNNSGDPVTAIVGTAANLYVSTLQRWWSVSPGISATHVPTIYPTEVDHGCVGKNAWTLRDGVVFYLALDGIRTFRAGGGQYISEVIEWVWQNSGPSAIPIADPTQFSTVQVSWWNRWVFFSYVGLDGIRHRIVLDVPNKRFRNDDLDAQSMFLEEDTATLVWGDSHGIVHLDRQLCSYDETNVGGTVVQSPIAIKMQSPYNNMGSPAEEKQFNELVIDANTGGNPVTCELLFDDGESSAVIGTVTTTERQRVNLNLNNGLGYTGYKASLMLTGQGTTRISLYQAALRHYVLAKTRQSLDTFWRKFSMDESKISRICYIEYTAQAPITMNVYYDGSSTPGPGFPYTLPQYSGVRNALKIILPAVKFRLLRLTLTSTADFQVWDDSVFFVKPICATRGYEKFPLLAVES